MIHKDVQADCNEFNEELKNYRFKGLKNNRIIPNKCCN